MAIFDFDDYRQFMKSYLGSLPKEGHGQARKIALHLNVSSTYVSQVLSGVKSFNLEQADLLAEFFGLSGLESEYFIYMIEKDRSGTKRLQQFWQNKLIKIREQAQKLSNRVEPQKILSDEDKATFYSNAIFSAVHLFTSTKSHGCTLEDIVQRFELSRAKGKQIIEFLKVSGLVIENDGAFTMSAQSTHVGSDSLHLLKHHTNWRLRAIGAGEALGDNELMYTSNVSLSKKDFDSLREQMVGFIKGFLKQVHASPAEDVACFNLDFFWIRK